MKHSQIWNKLIIIIHIVTWMTMIDDSVGNSHHITGPFYQYDGNQQIFFLSQNQYRSLSNQKMWTGFTFLEKTLFTRNSTTAKSYIVGFKYVGDVTSTVIYSGVIQSNAQVSVIRTLCQIMLVTDTELPVPLICEVSHLSTMNFIFEKKNV